MPGHNDKDAIIKVWETQGLEGHLPNATIRPAHLDEETTDTLKWTNSPSDIGLGTWLPKLAVAKASPDADAPFDLEIAGELGQGGMGVVSEAHQRSLARGVAVKRIRADKISPQAVGALLAEARITGGLEHPNIIPVHALGLDQDGLPILVMKRVRGVAWRTMLLDPNHEAWGRLGEDRLRWNIETMVQVCHAIEFAHAKGVIHRDLKTENVMIGAFGEVYVLDWGIAMAADASTLDAMTTNTSKAAQAMMGGSGVVGTPAYMAPEMTRGDIVDERTDVYLMGAMLHEILTGQPRHSGSTIFEVLYRAHLSAPCEYGPEIPEELATLCNRATNPTPEERPQSARALRWALRDFLQHKTSIEMSDTARERLGELELSLAAVSGQKVKHIGRLFTECRFGFRQALRAWPNNTRATEGLKQCLEMMMRHELKQGNLSAAETILDDCDTVSDDLLKAVDELREKHDAERTRVAALEAVAHGMDTRISSRQRGLAVLLFAVASGLLSLGLITAISDYNLVLDHSKGFIVASCTAAMLTVLGLFFRKALTRNRVNRQLSIAFAIYIILFLIFRLVAWRVQIPFIVVPVFELITLTLVCALLTAILDMRMVWATILSGLCMAAGAIFPEAIFSIFSIGVALVTTVVGAVWYRSEHVPG